MKRIVILVSIIFLLSGCIGLFNDDGSGSSVEIEYDEESNTLNIVSLSNNVSIIEVGSMTREVREGDSVSLAGLQGTHEVVIINRNNEGELVRNVVREVTVNENTVDDNGENNEDENVDEVSIQDPEEYDSQWMVVDKDDSLDYNSIQEAIDEAQPLQKIIVAEGEYNENLQIDKNVEIVTAGEVILSGSGGTGIEVGKHAAPVIDGFIIEGYETAFKSTESLNEWKLKNTIMRDNDNGVLVTKSASNWVVNNIEIKNSSGRAFEVDESYGEWTVDGARIYGNLYGMTLRNMKHEYNIERASVHSNENHDVRSTRTDVRGVGNEVWIGENEARMRINNQCSTVDCDGKFDEGFVREYMRDINHFNDKSVPRKINVGDAEHHIFLSDALENAQEGDMIVVKNDEIRPFEVSNSGVTIVGDTNRETQPTVTGDGTCVRVQGGTTGVRLINLRLAECTRGLEAGEDISLYGHSLTITENVQGVYLRQTEGEVYIEYSTIRDNSVTDVNGWGMLSGEYMFESSDIGNARIGNAISPIKMRWNHIYGDIESDGTVDIEVDGNYWEEGFSVDRVSKIQSHGNPCSEPECWSVRTEAKTFN